MEIEYLKFKNELLNRIDTIKHILLILIILTAVLALYIYVTPETYKEEYIASSCTHYGEYTYTAPVTLANPIYSKGIELEMGMPAYFFAVSPTVDMTFDYHLEASDSVAVDIQVASYLVASSGAAEETFWNKSFLLASSSTSKGENGNVIHTFTINVPEIQGQIQSVQDQIGYSQGMETEVLTIVSYEGILNNRVVDEKEQFSFPLTITNSYYQFPEELEFSSNDEFYMGRNVTKKAGFAELKVPLVILIILVSLLLLTGQAKKLETTDAEYIQKLEMQRENSKFDDWISPGQFPESIDFPQVRVDSLQGLVDIAADMDARVIKDSEKELYFAIKDAIIYLFSQ